MIATITYEPRYAKIYADLNREWIEKHFRIEPLDVKQLENPQAILDQGGEIFFVLIDGEPRGTCAMIPTAVDGEYELAKMAVSPKARGKGLGDVLMTTSIEWAKAKNAHTVMLHSNTILEPAITLYKKHGFETVHLGPHPDYERANIEMKLSLRA